MHTTLHWLVTVGWDSSETFAVYPLTWEGEVLMSSMVLDLTHFRITTQYGEIKSGSEMCGRFNPFLYHGPIW